MPLKAKPDCCEECKMGMPGYIPCNEPATKVVGWPNEGPYRMCDMCADHSVNNRGAVLYGAYPLKGESDG